ncbi:MAG TPA: hypothetical protein VI547_10665, partial [Anaerolineales bacterium]|nr:hypothetical protein [Anaerolineales bacterium]
MKHWKTTLTTALLVLSQILAACASPATEVPPTEAPPEPTAPPAATATTAPTAVPTATPVPEPIDIELWALATVTEAGPPPDDWIAYDIIREELNINLTYVIMPTGADGEAKLNAAAAANDLPDLFQLTSASNDNRGALFRFVELGLVAPVEDLMPLMPERTKLHYNDPLLLDLVAFDGHQYGLPEPPP